MLYCFPTTVLTVSGNEGLAIFMANLSKSSPSTLEMIIQKMYNVNIEKN